MDVRHQKDSWFDERMSLDYLDIVRDKYFPGREQMVLFWDVFPAHRKESVKEKAEQLGVLMKFIPAGCTGELQPLDFRIFGIVKSMVRSRFLREQAAGATAITIETALRIWLEAWESLTPEQVLAAWAPLRGETTL